MREVILIEELALYSGRVFGKCQELRQAWDITEPRGSFLLDPREPARSHRKCLLGLGRRAHPVDTNIQWSGDQRVISTPTHLISSRENHYK